jgi:hypothetical protein
MNLSEPRREYHSTDQNSNGFKKNCGSCAWLISLFAIILKAPSVVLPIKKIKKEATHTSQEQADTCDRNQGGFLD